MPVAEGVAESVLVSVMAQTETVFVGAFVFESEASSVVPVSPLFAPVLQVGLLSPFVPALAALDLP